MTFGTSRGFAEKHFPASSPSSAGQFRNLSIGAGDNSLILGRSPRQQNATQRKSAGNGSNSPIAFERSLRATRGQGNFHRLPLVRSGFNFDGVPFSLSIGADKDFAVAPDFDVERGVASKFDHDIFRRRFVIEFGAGLNGGLQHFPKIELSAQN